MRPFLAREPFVAGEHDLVLVTLDTLRFDVAERAWREGRTPTLRALLPRGWERRHTPASFTLAAHQAFFAGFLPTPVAPGRHARRFAMRFEGSETTSEATCVLDAADIPSGLRALGYHTACVGGTGFFNQRNPLGRVLPDLFAEAHWSEALGVTDPRSTEHQLELAASILARRAGQRVFLFVNVSAIHQPNRFYLPGATEDSLASHEAALTYVDAQLARLVDAITARRAPTLLLLCADHGTLYGEDGYVGHRVGHPIVWTVPYGEVFFEARARDGEGT